MVEECQKYELLLLQGNEHINLKVTGQDGSVVHFKIKKNTPLRKLMNAYCDRTVSKRMVLLEKQELFTTLCAVTFTKSIFCLQGVKSGAMRFRFDGQPINETDTPTQVLGYC